MIDQYSLVAINNLKEIYWKYVKDEDSIWTDLCNFEKIIKNKVVRSANDFTSPEFLPASLLQFKRELESVEKAFKFCFIEHREKDNNGLCYTLMLDIHNLSTDVTLSLFFN